MVSNCAALKSNNKMVCYFPFQRSTGYKYSVLSRQRADMQDTGSYVCKNAKASLDQDVINIVVKTQGTL